MKYILISLISTFFALAAFAGPSDDNHVHVEQVGSGDNANINITQLGFGNEINFSFDDIYINTSKLSIETIQEKFLDNIHKFTINNKIYIIFIINVMIIKTNMIEFIFF